MAQRESEERDQPSRERTAAEAQDPACATARLERALRDAEAQNALLRDEVGRRDARQGFLRKLGDALRLLRDDAAIQAVACRELGEYLAADRTFYAEVADEGEHAEVHSVHSRIGPPTVAGPHALSSYRTTISHLSSGTPLVIGDTRSTDLLPPEEAATYLKLGVRAALIVPFVVDAWLVRSLNITCSEPRVWRDDEVALASDVADRTWAAVARARTEAVLRERQEQLAMALNAARMGTFDWDPASDSLAFSNFSHELFGLTQDGGRSARLEALSSIHPDEREGHFALLRGAAELGTEYRSEYRVLNRGRLSWIEERGSRVLDSVTNGVRVRGVHWDVSERRRAAEALAADLRDTRLLRDLSVRLVSATDVHVLYEAIMAAAIALSGADGGTVWIYDAATEELHLLASSGITQTMRESFERIDASAETRVGSVLARGERTFVSFDTSPDEREEYRLFREAGYSTAQATPLVARSGRPLGMLSTHWRGQHTLAERELRFLDLLARQAADVLEVRRVAEALRESETRFRTLVQSVQDYAIFMLDVDGRVREWPEGAARVMGYTASEVLGQHFALFYTKEDVAAGLAARELRAAREHGRFEVEGYRVRKDGTRFWANVIATAVRDPQGRVVGYTKVSRDLSAHKRMQEQREQLLQAANAAKAQAEEANRIKDEFLATLSHELRTPLASILLWGRMLRAGTVRIGDLPRAFEAIVQSAESQSRLVEDLLDLSRLHSGKLQLSLGPVDVESVVRAAFEVIRPLAESKGIALSLDCGALGHARLDGGRFQQVLWNLLSNAVKFTDRGGRVALRAAREERTLKIEVRDNGQGIPQSFMPFVFERFRQAEMDEKRKHAGLGIGLALCRQLVELHHGTIDVQSAGPGKGSLFTVQLPWIPLAAAAAPAVADMPERSSVRVLLVEDDDSMREAMHWTLERAGAAVLSVGSAQEALGVVQRTYRNTRYEGPQVIVSDIGLPEMSGYELIERVHAHCSAIGGRRIPACAVSAHVRDADRERALRAGFDRYLAKPVTPEELVRTVQELAEPVQPARGEA
jgi:PAS domain S-box-containing protein